jgi:hypothetical protein
MANEISGAARGAPKHQDPRALSAESIQALRDAGFTVVLVIDLGPPRYGWSHAASGASQTDLKECQPMRRTEAQAWVDCRDYFDGDLPSPPTPDWLS